MKHQHPLDSLRGVLAVVVVSAHAWQIFGQPAALEGTGWVAVTLGLSARVAVLAFFALSGYVIAASVGANIAANGSFRSDQFALSRAFRIVPPLVAVILATALLEAGLRAIDASAATAPGAARKVFRTDAWGQFRALYTLCTRGELTGAWLNGPLWSLTYEIRLYVVAGLLASVLASPGWVGRVGAAVLLWVYLAAIRFDPLSPAVDLQKVSFAAFLCGAIAYRFRTAPTRYLLAAAVLALFAAAVRLNGVQGSVVEGLDQDPLVLAAQVAASIAFAIAVVLIGRGPAWRVLEGAGSYSYTLYIGHFPLLLGAYFVCANYAPGLLQGKAAIFTAVAAFMVSWLVLAKAGRWVERPREQREASAALLQRLKRVGGMVTPAAAFALLSLAPTEAPAARNLPVIQLFGDSTQVQAYPLLRARYGDRVINSAKGETRSGMLLTGTDGVNLPWPQSVRAPIVIINHGLNDARPWARVPLADYKRNLRRLAQAPARVIFETPNPSTALNRDSAPYAQAMREVAREMKVELIDVHACFLRQPDWRDRLPDGVHPDAEGLAHIVDICLAPTFDALLR